MANDPILNIVTMRLPVGSRLDLIARARRAFLNRGRRSKLFGKEMFGEHGWDILLALYMMEANGPRQTVGSLRDLTHASAGATNRWLDYLEDHKLVVREENPVDKRSTLVRLTPKARDLLDTYFSETAVT